MNKKTANPKSLLHFKYVTIVLFIFPLVSGLHYFSQSDALLNQILRSSLIAFSITAAIYLFIICIAVNIIKYLDNKILSKKIENVGENSKLVNRDFVKAILYIDFPLAILGGLTRFIWCKQIASHQDAISVGLLFCVLFIALNFLSTLVIAIAKR